MNLFSTNDNIRIYFFFFLKYFLYEKKKEENNNETVLQKYSCYKEIKNILSLF